VLAAVAAVLVVATFRAMDREDARVASPLVVRVVAAKWDWRFGVPDGYVETGSPGEGADVEHRVSQRERRGDVD
jgi:heme/copper-type cytochrome/quinol oxidase subunit 2